MGTAIKTWQIIDRKLQPVTTSLQQEGRNEPYDLEAWIESDAGILGSDIVIIGRQTMSKAGPIDLLGIDKTGNLVIVELKRDKLPRGALCQAIDYASATAEWSIEKLSEICSDYLGRSLEETLTESFPDVDVEGLSINDTQRIILVGFSVESALERMIGWLSDSFNVNINAVVLSYAKTASGDELLTKTSIISEELEKERVKKTKSQIPMSDEPGEYEPEALRTHLREYFAGSGVTRQRMREVLLPTLLERDTLTRDELKEMLCEHDRGLDPFKAGMGITSMSYQLGFVRNDFLRQVVAYEYPNHEYEKDNFSLHREFKPLVRELLDEINGNNA